MIKKLIKPADIIIIIAFIAIAIASAFLFTGSEGEQIIISKGGEQIASMPLSVNDKFTVDGVTVTVKDGGAFIEQSDCKDKICMRSTLEKSGDCAICLPNKISVTVSGKPDADAVTY